MWAVIIFSVLFILSVVSNIQSSLNEKAIIKQVKKEMAERSEEYRLLTQHREVPQRIAIEQLLSALQK